MKRKPSVAFATRIDLESDARRQRLQDKLNCSGAELVARALKALEAQETLVMVPDEQVTGRTSWPFHTP